MSNKENVFENEGARRSTRPRKSTARVLVQDDDINHSKKRKSKNKKIKKIKKRKYKNKKN